MVRTLCTDQEKTGPCASRPPGSASTRDRGAVRWAIRPARTEHNTDVSNPRHWAPRPYPSFVTTVPCRPYPRHEWRRRPRAGDGRVSPTATHAGARRRASVAGWPRDARGGPAVTARCRSRGPLAEGRGGGTRPPLEARLYAPARPPNPRFRPIPARSGGGGGLAPARVPTVAATPATGKTGGVPTETGDTRTTATAADGGCSSKVTSVGLGADGADFATWSTGLGGGVWAGLGAGTTQTG